MRVLVVALALLVAGCASSPPVGAPAAAAPDLRGTWTGTWGGAPLSLLVTEQAMGPGDAGLAIGPWQVLGERYPTATGVITSTVEGAPVSSNMNGVIWTDGAGILLTVYTRSAAGDQRLTLRHVDGDRLQGTGESQFRWGPQGSVQLVRRPRQRGRASEGKV